MYWGSFEAGNVWQSPSTAANVSPAGGDGSSCVDDAHAPSPPIAETITMSCKTLFITSIDLTTKSHCARKIALCPAPALCSGDAERGAIDEIAKRSHLAPITRANARASSALHARARPMEQAAVTMPWQS